MPRKAIVTVLIWSLVSFGLCMVLFAPASLQAYGPDGPRAIARPAQSITTADYKLELKLADQPNTDMPLRRMSVEPGRAPKMQVIASSTSDKSITIETNFQMNSTSLASMRSRTPRASNEIWNYSMDISLDAGKSRTVGVPCDIELKDSTMVNVVMSDGTSRVVPIALAVKTQDAAPGGVAAR